MSYAQTGLGSWWQFWKSWYSLAIDKKFQAPRFLSRYEADSWLMDTKEVEWGKSVFLMKKEGNWWKYVGG